MSSIVGLILGVVAFFFALGFPDWDLNILRVSGIIVHRSLITHSALVVVLVALVTSVFGRDICGIATLGAAIGLACHLVPDMFPEAWRGFAFIYIPFLGRLTWIPLDGDWIPTIFSFLWLGGNVLGGFAIFNIVMDLDE